MLTAVRAAAIRCSRSACVTSRMAPVTGGVNGSGAAETRGSCLASEHGNSDRHGIGRVDRLGVGPRYFAAQGFDVDRHRQRHARAVLRRRGLDTATRDGLRRAEAPSRSLDIDIRDRDGRRARFRRARGDVELVVHTAAQPSHDWAARDPHTDFGVNAVGTLNLLEAARDHSPDAMFIFTSTNKVYGDTPNRLPLVELETRWELEPTTRVRRHRRDDVDRPVARTRSSARRRSRPT